MDIIVTLLTNSILLLLVAHFTDGFEIKDWTSAIIGAVVLAILNATIARVFIFFSIPFIALTLGLFIFVINAIILKIMASFVAGVKIRDFNAALIASLLMALFTAIANIIF
ncbi:MAG TPA: phage holin family protein [Anaerolineae bacterium]|nr:phage holin family protein [Anaerolineae bacterium]